MSIINKIRFQIIRYHSLKCLRNDPTFSKDAVYLTFDDGPEPGITEFVLDELNKYNMKSTFFCCGKNCKEFPKLLERIKGEGHSVANHTHSHISGYTTPQLSYMEDVELCESYLSTNIFRPPWGALTFSLYKKLRYRYRIVYWDVVSGDTEGSNFNLKQSFDKFKKNIKPGSVVLFHFCNLSANETRQILPICLKYLSENHFKTATF